MAKTYSIKAIFEVVDKAARPLQKVGNAFSKLNTKIVLMSKQLEKAGKKMNDIGKSLSAKLTLPITALGTATIAASFNFNKMMANIATLIPGNIKRVEELKKGVQKMAIEMGQSTGDLADGLYQVISAFGDSKNSIERLRITSKAASAGLASTGDTLNLLSQITKDYGDTSLKGMTKASDLAFLAVKEGQTSFEALAQSMSMVIPTAAKMKLSQEELFAAMATFTRGAQTTPMIVTQLNAVLTALASPTKAMEKRFAQLGVKSGSLMIEQKGLAETMKLLTKDGSATNEELIALFGNVIAGRLAMGFAGAGAKLFNEKLKKMTDYAGTTNTAFKEITDGINKFGFTWSRFMSLLEVLAQDIGDILAPALIEIVTFFREWIQKFRELSPEIKKLILLIAGIVAALGPLLFIFGSFFVIIGTGIKTIGFLVKGIGLLITVIKSLSVFFIANPILLAIVAIATAAFLIIKYWSPIKGFFIDLWDGIIKYTKIVGSTLYDYIVEPFIRAYKYIKDIFGGVIDKIFGTGKIDVSIKEEKRRRLVTSKNPYAATALKGAIGVSRMEGGVDVNVNVSADAGSTAIIDKVNKKGKSKVKINNTSALGLSFGLEGGW